MLTRRPVARSLKIGGMGAEEHQLLSGGEDSNSFLDFHLLGCAGYDLCKGLKLNFY